MAKIKQFFMTDFILKTSILLIAACSFAYLMSSQVFAIGSGTDLKVKQYYNWKNPVTGETVTRSTSNPPIYITFLSGTTLGNNYGANKKFWEEYYQGEFLWYSPVPPEQLVESNADYDRYILKENKQTVWGSGYRPESVKNWFVNRNFSYNLKKGSYDYEVSGGWLNAYHGDNSGTTTITTKYLKGGVTYNYIGKNYEWRYLGYSSDGNIVGNPYFPPDYPSKPDWSPSKKLWIWQPWADGSANGSKWDEDSQQSQYDRDAARKDKWLAELFFEQNPWFLLTKKSGETDEQLKLRSAKYWHDAMLIKTNPEWSTGVVQMYHNGDYPNEDGLWYMLWTMKTPDKPNLRITTYKIIDTETNKVVGSVTRNGSSNKNLNTYTKVDKDFMLERGKEYKIVADVKNMPVEKAGKDTKITPLGLDLHIAYDNDADLINEYTESHYVEKEAAQSGAPKNNESKIAYNKVVQFDKNREGAEWTFTVPENPNVAKKKMKVRVEIPLAHYIAGENAITEDDFAELVLPIEQEDFGTLETANLLKDGVPVDEVNSETTYDLQFFVYKPYGKTPVGDLNNLATNPFASLQVVVKNNLGSKVYTATAKKVLNKGQTILIEVKGVKTGTLPWLEAEWQVRQIHRDLAQSVILTNDGPYKQRWESEINISVQNFKVEPQVIHRGQHQPAGAENLVVSYEVMNANPDALSKEVETVITNLGTGQKWVYNDVFIGNKEQTFSKNLGLVNLGFGNNKFSVEVNPKKSDGTRRWYEYKKNGVNPYLDNIDYQAILVDQTIQKEYCEAVHTRNDWNQTYTKSLYYQYWAHDEDGYPYPSDSLVSTTYENVHHWENYKIEKADFTSRDYDGDVLNGVAKIRAGYGFELEIDVHYETNVDKDSPKPWNTGRTGYRLDVYPPIYPVSMPQNLYLEMPYKAEDGQNVRYKLDVVSKQGSWDDMTITYALPQRDAFGKETNRRIYFNEKVANGVYTLRVDTEAFYGYSNKPAVPYLLCDTKKLQVQVVGSDADDVKSHITQ